MAVRELVRIDEDKCTGCGDCVTACAEGAIQIVDGKARLVSEIYCDGLGACIGHCPEDAITIEKVDAKSFDEGAVERHLAALETRGGIAALAGLGATPKPAPRPAPKPAAAHHAPHPSHGGGGGCPGSRMFAFEPEAPEEAPDAVGTRRSELRQWPVQLHLVSPYAPYFRGADVLLAADCTAFTAGDFHKDHLAGHALAIACPKLDDGRDVYIDKLASLFEDAAIQSLTVLVMEVPCCAGLVGMARTARDRAKSDVPIPCRTLSVRGEVIDEETM